MERGQEIQRKWRKGGVLIIIPADENVNITIKGKYKNYFALMKHKDMDEGTQSDLVGCLICDQVFALQVGVVIAIMIITISIEM